MENESVVTQDTGSATVESNVDPSGGSSEVGTQQSQGSPGKSYSEEQVQQMIRARIAQQQKAHARQLSEYQQKQQQYEQMAQRMNQGIEAMGRGFGFIQEEKADPFNERFSSLEKQMEEKLEARFRKQEEERLYSRITDDWKAVSTKYDQWADLPGFKDAWAKSWGPGVDPVAAAAKLVEAYEKRFAAKSNASAEVKEGRLRSAPVKSGGGTVAGAKSDESVPLRKSIIAAFKGGD